MDVVSSRPVLPLAYTENEGVPMEVNRSFVQAEQPYVHLTDARFLSRERAIGPTPAAAVDVVEDEEIVVGITGEVAALEDHRFRIHRRTVGVDSTARLPDIQAVAGNLWIVAQRPRPNDDFLGRNASGSGQGPAGYELPARGEKAS